MQFPTPRRGRRRRRRARPVPATARNEIGRTPNVVISRVVDGKPPGCLVTLSSVVRVVPDRLRPACITVARSDVLRPEAKFRVFTTTRLSPSPVVTQRTTNNRKKKKTANRFRSHRRRRGVRCGRVVSSGACPRRRRK